MKPIKLVMNAFGPYKGKAEIDFMKLKDKSLFLITGPTGAGKSTIFDAITFALYGKGNLEGKGYEKDSKNFKSDFSGIEDEAYVEFDFEVKGKPYSIKRYPAQEVKRLRGEGTRDKSEEAVLSYRNSEGDTVVRDKLNDIKNEIELIIGLSVEQFRQIMMIPQGQFKKVISSDTKERKDVLQKLFDISVCSKIQEGLKIKAKDKEIEIKEIEKRIEENFSFLNNDVEKYENPEGNVYERLDYYLNLNKVKEAEIEQIEKSIISLDKEISKLNQEKGSAELVNRLIDEKERVSREIEVEKSKEKEYFNKENIFKTAKRAVKVKEKEERYLEIKADREKTENRIKEISEILNKKRVDLKLLESQIELGKLERAEMDSLFEKTKRLESMDDVAKKLSEQSLEISSLTKDVEGGKTELLKAVEKRDKLKLELLNQEELNLEQRKILDDRAVLESELAEIKMSMEFAKGLDQKFKELNDMASEYKILLLEKKSSSSKLSDAEKEYKESEDEYKKMNLQYNNQLVSRLRRQLKEGENCPVCGSVKHGKFEEKSSGNQVTEGMLKEKEDRIAKDREVISELRESLVKYQSRCEEHINRGKRLTEEIFDSCEKLKIEIDRTAKAKKAKEKFLAYFFNLTGTRHNLRKEKDRLSELLEKTEKIISENRGREIEINRLGEEIQEINKKTSEIQMKLSEKTINTKNEKEKIFGDDGVKSNYYEAYKNLLSETKDFALKLKKKFDDEDKLYQEIEREISTKTGEKNSFTNNLKEYIEKEDELKIAFKESIEISGFNSEEEYRKGYMAEALMISMEKEINEYRDKVSRLEDRLGSLSKSIGEGTKIDTLSLEKSIEESLAEKSVYEGKRSSLEISSRRIVETTKVIRENYENNEKAIEEYEKIKDLSDVANRQNKMNASFESYVLSTYLDEILEFTNQRFNKMTDGRYEIFRKEEITSRVAESGLDLEVMDYYSSKRRDISTLSGGEGFKASLSMALGLSDVVRMYSGGIGLDTIFIDEGFGTLDAESLDMAIDTLVEIQNQGRLVGIISHVEDLKERIPEKIIIESTSEGSIIRAFES